MTQSGGDTGVVEDNVGEGAEPVAGDEEQQSFFRWALNRLSQTFSSAPERNKEYWDSLTQEQKRRHYHCKGNYVTLQHIEPWPRCCEDNGVESQASPPTPHYLYNEAFNRKISLWRGDITHLEVDAIVNSANNSLMGGPGVNGAIHKAAGSSLKVECKELNGCDTGDVKITSGHRLPAKWVLHAVGPMKNRMDKMMILRKCYERSLQLVLEHNLHSVAFCCIATGVYAFPREEACEIALDTTRKWLETNYNAEQVHRIIFAVFTQKDYDIYRSLMHQFFPVSQEEVDVLQSLVRHNSLTSLAIDQLDEPIAPDVSIGSGSYGKIYEVRYKGAVCAAKKLHDILLGLGQEEPIDRAQYGLLLDKFKQECITLSNIRHPNVVQFIGIYKPDDDPRNLVLVMEKMIASLTELIDEHFKKNPLQLPFRLQILKDVSAGVRCIHSLNIVHRDLNSGNILLTDTLQAKVADFGVSRIMDQVNHPKPTKSPGAPDYMPPEATCSEPNYDEKLDIFSFGHLALYVANWQYPNPNDRDKSEENLKSPAVDIDVAGIEIQRRKKWLLQLSSAEDEHCLYKLILQCLQDKKDKRPSIMDVYRQLEECCREHQVQFVLEPVRKHFSTFITHEDS